MGVGQWSHGLCGCFDDFGTCIIAYFAPCVVFGQTAEAIGEGSCMTCGLAYFIPFFDLYMWVKIRGKIREMKGIQGSGFSDCMTIICCPLCAMVQEAQEVKTGGPSAQNPGRHNNETRSNVTLETDTTDPDYTSVYVGGPILAIVLIAGVCTVFMCWKRKQAINKRIILHVHRDSDVSIRPVSSVSCEFDFERYCADRTRSYFGFESPEDYMTDDELIVPGVLASDI